MIQVSRLTKRFGRTVAVNEVSFQVPDGAVFCLLGPNGSGKTTTLKMLAGLVHPTAGAISINDLDLEREEIGVKRLLSYLPQRVLFPENLTASEILGYFARLRGVTPAAANDALNNAGLAGVGSKPIGQFSGGMVQRLGMAVVMMPDAPILLLDEPTASLDPEGVVRFRNFVVEQKAAGKTIVFSTHLLSEAGRLADLVAFYLGGRLVALQAVEQFRSEAAAFQTMEEFYLHHAGAG